MANLMGLSPAEISQISAGRRSDESMKMNQMKMLLNVLGGRQASSLGREKLDLEREKFELQKSPQMVQMKIGENLYEIPRGAQAEGVKAKAYVEDLYRKGQMERGKYEAWMKPVKTSLPSATGEWTEYNVPSGMLKEMATGAKSLQAGMISGAEEERTRKGLQALGGQTIGDIEGIPLSTLATTMPSGVISAMLAKSKAGAAAGIKPEERRKLIMDQENSAFKMLEEGEETSKASVSAYNDRSKTLGYPSMMLKATEPGMLYGTNEVLVEVKLPVAGGVQMTPTDVERTAKQKEISIEERLREIHEGNILIEQVKEMKLKAVTEGK